VTGGQVTNLWLESCLAPLAPYLAREDVTDIYINRPGELWLEALGGAAERHGAPHLTRPLLYRLARQVAAVSAQGINRANPILSASLPDGERIQIVMPPATRGEIAMAIRKHAVSAIRLEDYAADGSFARTTLTSAAHAERREPFSSPTSKLAEAPLILLRGAVRQRRNILISGGTATGKTTFLNALLAEVPLHERLILIEDTPELQAPHPNCVGLLASRSPLGEAQISAEDLLVATLRLRPDRIMLGEIRGSEAATFLRAVNTGHPGSISTIHADSPSRAMDQLALLVLQTGIRMNWEDVITYVRKSLDFIVQLKRDAGGRSIVEIMSL